MNIKKILKRLDKSRYVNVHDLNKYIALPEVERTTKKWFWFGPWYILPMGLPMGSIQIFKKSFTDKSYKTEWDKCYDFLRNQYPIQTFLRNDLPRSEFISFFEYKWKELVRFYRKWVLRTFKPYNTNVRKVIPSREWRDKKTLISDVLFAMVKDFVEVEKCFEYVDFYSDGQQKSVEFADKLKEVYNFITVEKEKIENEISNLLTVASEKEGDLSYEDRYGELNAAEEKFNKLEEEYLTWIVKNRDMFWV